MSKRAWRHVYAGCIAWTLFWLGYAIALYWQGRNVWWDTALLLLGLWVGFYARWKAGIPTSWLPGRKRQKQV